MILINLLPHREERRKRRRTAFFVALGFAAVIGFAFIALWYGVLEQMMSTQQERNRFLTAEIAKLDLQIKDIATLRTEIEALKARQGAVEDLQSDRNVPVHILNDLVRLTPEGIYFVAVKQEGSVLTVSGIAQSNERVSEFLRNTGTDSQWLVRPELVEIKAATAQTASREQRRVFEFSVRLNVRGPPDRAKGGASSAGAAARKA